MTLESQIIEEMVVRHREFVSEAQSLLDRLSEDDAEGQIEVMAMLSELQRLRHRIIAAHICDASRSETKGAGDREEAC